MQIPKRKQEIEKTQKPQGMYITVWLEARVCHNLNLKPKWKGGTFNT